jgi:putative oxidoreductase
LTYLLHTNSDWLQLLVRLTLGIVFFAHGAQKMLGWFKGPGFKNSIKSLNEHVNIPVALGFLAIAAEFFGGLGLIVGLLSRIAAAGVVVTMVVAIVLVHRRYGLFLNWFGDREGNGYEYHLLAIALAMVIIVRGSGALSLDHLLYRNIQLALSAATFQWGKP